MNVIDVNELNRTEYITDVIFTETCNFIENLSKPDIEFDKKDKLDLLLNEKYIKFNNYVNDNYNNSKYFTDNKDLTAEDHYNLMHHYEILNIINTEEFRIHYCIGYRLNRFFGKLLNGNIYNITPRDFSLIRYRIFNINNFTNPLASKFSGFQEVDCNSVINEKIFNTLKELLSRIYDSRSISLVYFNYISSLCSLFDLFELLRARVDSNKFITTNNIYYIDYNSDIDGKIDLFRESFSNGYFRKYENLFSDNIFDIISKNKIINKIFSHENILLSNITERLRG